MGKAYRFPLPPSANKLWRPAFIGPVRCKSCNSMHVERPGLRLVSTREASDFTESVRNKLEKLRPELIRGPVEVRFTVYVDTLSSDGPNREKALFDVLQGFFYDNDSQIGEWHGFKTFADDKHPAGIVIEVLPADPQHHAELARRLAKSSIGARAAEQLQSKMFGETPTGGGSKPPDSRGGGHTSPRPRVVLPESMQERFARLARSAVVPNRPPEDPETK